MEKEGVGPAVVGAEHLEPRLVARVVAPGDRNDLSEPQVTVTSDGAASCCWTDASGPTRAIAGATVSVSPQPDRTAASVPARRWQTMRKVMAAPVVGRSARWRAGPTVRGFTRECARVARKWTSAISERREGVRRISLQSPSRAVTPASSRSSSGQGLCRGSVSARMRPALDGERFLVQQFRRSVVSRGADDVGEAREDVGVDTVRLGELPGRLGEVAHLTRVDHDDGQRRGGEGGDREQLVAARGFQHDQRRRDAPEPLDERVHPALLVVHGEPFRRRQEADHQLRLRHVDADEHASPPRVWSVASPVLVRIRARLGGRPPQLFGLCATRTRARRSG